MSWTDHLASAHDSMTQEVHGRAVTVGPSGRYATLREMFANQPGSAMWPVVATLEDGTHTVIQVDSLPYVSVVGTSKAGTIIVADGTSTEVDPVSGVAYADMDRANKHMFKPSGGLSLSTLTINVNEVKYVVHQDSGDAGSVVIDNCILRGHDIDAITGHGLRGGQTFTLTNSTIGALAGGTAPPVVVHAHNMTTQASACGVLVEDCDCEDLQVARLEELLSGQTDDFVFRRCTTTAATALDYDAGTGVTDADPYNVEVTVDDCGTFPLIYDAVNRPDALAHITVT